MFTLNGTAQILGQSDITHVSSHTAYPGETGANEQSGGTPVYSRPSFSFSVTRRTLTQTGTSDLDVPAGPDHAWFAFWNAVSAGNCRAIVPAGGQAMEYSVDLATDIFTT